MRFRTHPAPGPEPAEPTRGPAPTPAPGAAEPRLRVAWLGHRSATGADGIITYSRETTRGLRERGVEVLFLHHARDQADDSSIALDSFAISHRLVLSPPSAKRRLMDVLRAHQIDLVHVSLAFSTLDFNLPEICHRLGIPVVATFHVPYDRRFSVWRGITSAVYRLYAQSLSGYDAVIIFGETQREILTGLGVPRDIVHVLPNGVDVDRYRPGPSTKREELGAERLFSYLGRLDPEKNVDVLLGAFLDADPPSGLRLVIMGGGVERRRLERRYADPRVAFTGVITDEQERIDVLRATDAFFLPSSVEGLSLAMLEAMACGAATVATDVGNDGEALRGAGIVLDPAHLESELRAAIRLLVDTPQLCPLLGRMARDRVVERYSLRSNLDALLALYRELVRTRSGPG
ncbi:MAG TPA: glycosyltransferase family 4 protein [Candidatus Dormibacteraeota bacterium]|nr:glycosyltransferase family 4 protein [Candidatus Dormibacteraeota bacterium]